MATQRFAEEYCKLLIAHATAPSEEYLAAAADLGRQLVLAGVPLEEIGELHDAAIQHLGQELPTPELAEVALRTGAPLIELFMVYGMRHRQREKEFRDCEERYRRLIEGLSQDYYFYRHGVDGVFTHISPSIVNVLGYSVDEYTTHYAEYLTDGAVNREVRRRTDLSLQGIRQTAYEIEAYHKDGSIRTLEVLETSVRDEDGIVTGVEGIAHDITERKRAERQLHELNVTLERRVIERTSELEKAKEEFERIFYLSPDMLCIAEINGYFRRVNPAWTTTLGYTYKELLAKPYLDFVHPDDREPTLEVIREKLERGETVIDFENRYRHKDGSYRWLKWTSRPIAEEGITYAVARDVTAEMEATEELRRHRDHLEELVAERTAELTEAVQELQDEITERARVSDALRLRSAALEAAANAIVVTDAQGIIQWINPAFTQLTGYGREELAGQTPRILKSGEQNPEFHEQLWETILAGRVWRGEIINRRKDGSLYTEEQTITPVRDERGQITHFVSVKQDITEKKRAEETLRIEKALLDGLFRGAPEALVLVDNGGHIIRLNRHFTKLFGHAEAEVLGRSIDELLAPEHLHREAAGITSRVASGEQVSVESVRKHKDGSLVHVSILGVPVSVGEGQVGVYGIYRDITERKRAEEALRESEDKLTEAQKLAKLGYYVLDTQHDCWTNSAELDDVFGIDANYKRDLDGWLQLVHPEFRETMAEYFQDHVMTRHNKFDKEYKIIDQNTGQEKWVHGLGHLRFDDNDNPVEMFGTIQDITERKRLERELVEIGERERQRLGRDLHDGLGQPLTGVMYLAKVLQDQLATTAPELAGNAQKIGELARETITYNRYLSRGLLPVSEDGGTLEDALHDFAETAQELFGMRCIVRYDCPRAVPGNVASQFYRIAQEAVTNAARYGQAASVVVACSSTPDGTELVITDDGVGIPDPLPATNGMGLRIMRYRAGTIGATLEITRGAEGGTVVRCVVPVSGSAHR